MDNQIKKYKEFENKKSKNKYYFRVFYHPDFIDDPNYRYIIISDSDQSGYSDPDDMLEMLDGYDETLYSNMKRITGHVEAMEGTWEINKDQVNKVVKELLNLRYIQLNDYIVFENDEEW